MNRESHRRLVHTAMLLLLAGALYGTLALRGAPADGLPPMLATESALLPVHAPQPEVRWWLGCLGFLSSL